MAVVEGVSKCRLYGFAAPFWIYISAHPLCGQKRILIRCLHIFIKNLFQTEHSFHRTPFFGRGHARFGLLEQWYIIFPFLLARQGGKTCHCGIPIKVERSFNNHEHSGATNVYLHFKYAHLAYSLHNLGPNLVVTFAIFGNRSGSPSISNVWQ